MEESKRKSNKLFLAVIIAVLLLLNLIFIYNFYTTDKKLTLTEEKLVSTEDAKAELEKLLSETEVQLDQYKGKNAQLDQMLKEKNDSLLDQAERIEQLLKKGQISERELAKARDELDVLRYYKQKYLRQIDELARIIIVHRVHRRAMRADSAALETQALRLGCERLDMA